MKTPLLKLTSLVMLLVLAGPAFAQEEEDLLDILVKKKVITQEEYDQLRRQYQKRPVPLPAPEPAAPPKPTTTEPAPETTAVTAEEASDVTVITQGALRGRTRDSAFIFQLGGRLLIDGAVYDSDVQSLGNGAEIRSARITLEGTVWNVWDYELEVDFAENAVDIKDAWLEYREFEPIAIQTGNYKEPFSLEEITSSKYITFMERALPNLFAPSRNLGVGVRIWREQWTGQLGVFGEGLDANEDREEDQGFGVTGRFTYAPILEEERLIHLGAAGSYRRTGDNDVLRFRSRPESHVTNVRLVDTGDIVDVEDIARAGAEAAVVWGPFSLQGEYIRTHLDRDSGFSDLAFDGYYVYGSWFLTGESRPYDDEKARFQAVLPKSIVGRGGYGAWEVALRYSGLDLEDEDIQGGEEDNLTVGLNWYPTRNIRFMANYIHADSERLGMEDDPHVFQIRSQIVLE